MSDQNETEEVVSSKGTLQEPRYQNDILNERGKQYGDALLTHQMIGKNLDRYSAGEAKAWNGNRAA